MKDSDDTMDDFPIQAILYGQSNMVFEPFCCGCAGFLISYRFTRTVPAKLLAILITILFFLWMDEIWPAMVTASAKLGIASGQTGFQQMLEDGTPLGKAEFTTGERSGLWDVYNLDASDIIHAALFVTLAFQLGLVLTKRRWNEPPTQTLFPPIPPGHPGRPVPPALPPTSDKSRP